MLQELNHATLGLLDQGRAAAIIDHAIQEAVTDLEDRGMDGKPRTIEIKIILKQIGEDRYAAEVQAGTKRPGWKTAGHTAEVRKRKGAAFLNFQEHDVDEPKQTRIEDREEAADGE